MSIVKLLMYSSISSPVVPIVIGYFRRRNLGYVLFPLFLLICAALASDLSLMTLAKLKRHNIVVAHIYGLVEGVLLLIFFARLTKTTRSIQILALIYSTLYVADSIFVEGLANFNVWARSAESLLMIGLSLYALYIFYKEEEDIFIEKFPEFWIVVGILVYFSGALFSFLLATDVLSQSPGRFYGSWALHNISNITKNMIFAVGLWKVRG